MGSKPHWAWWIHIVIGGLLVLVGAFAFFFIGTDGTFETDTGVAKDDVAADYPTVVDHVTQLGHLVGVAVAGLGAVTLVVAWAGRGGAAALATRVLWIVAATVALLGLPFILNGKWALAIQYGLFALAMAVAQLLLRPGDGSRGR